MNILLIVSGPFFGKKEVFINFENYGINIDVSIQYTDNQIKLDKFYKFESNYLFINADPGNYESKIKKNINLKRFIKNCRFDIKKNYDYILRIRSDTYSEIIQSSELVKKLYKEIEFITTNLSKGDCDIILPTKGSRKKLISKDRLHFSDLWIGAKADIYIKIFNKILPEDSPNFINSDYCNEEILGESIKKYLINSSKKINTIKYYDCELLIPKRFRNSRNIKSFLIDNAYDVQCDFKNSAFILLKKFLSNFWFLIYIKKRFLRLL